MGILDLAGVWKLSNAHGGSVGRGPSSDAPAALGRPAQIPGDVLSALVASGEAPDPYRGTGELDCLWVGGEDWTLEREFELSAAQAGSLLAFLEIESLDTIAELKLNDASLPPSNNMFVPYRAPLAGLLRAGLNRLSITIRSPERAAAEAAASLPWPSPASKFPNSSPHRNLIRKSQCMSGWDWGPCLMTGGVYGSVRLVLSDGPVLAYADAMAKHEGGGWRVDCELTVDLARPARLRLGAVVGAPESGKAPRPDSGFDESDATASAFAFADAPRGSSVHRLSVPVEDPSLWWPAGHGDQPLYPVRLSAVVEDEETASVAGSPAASPAEASAIVRVGFRTLRLVAEPDADGSSMAFEINGRRVFLKGANWIPQDALPSRWNDEAVRGLLDAALEANMNCLRVWGGGRYESDGFYEHCDRTGLMIWQDFMFACATYPATPDFMANVESEARAQVRRLRGHPSLAIWCGNNENLGAIGWYEESKDNLARYIVDYDRLNEGVLGRAAKELDPERPWWPSSPSAGPGNYGDNWHADGAGDMHYWSVWHEGKPFAAYLEVRPRFCSEFGFQSLPSARTAAEFATPSQRNVTSPVMEHHQRHPRGNEIILGTMLRYFRMPEGWERTLYLSQVQQAMAIRTAADWWRSTTPRCMGILYWQLNDVWPCASWSSLEYGGRRKLLHRDARRFFAPVAPLLVVKDGRLLLSAVNDGPAPWRGSLTLRVLELSGAELLRRDWPAAIEPLSAQSFLQTDLAELPAGPAECFAVAELVPSDGAGDLPPRTFCFMTEPKRYELPEPKISSAVAELEGGGFAVELRCDAPAFWLCAEAPTRERDGQPEPLGEFDDAGFLLLPGETKRLVYTPAPGESRRGAKDFEAGLRFMHL